MSNVLTQTIVYVVLLFAGYGFKKAGIFKVEDTDFLKKVILYLTMPAMAVNGLKDLELQPSFLWCFLVGFGTSTILMLVGMAATRKKAPEEKVMYLFNLNTYNIGNFAIPFLTGLLSTDGFAALCLFDIGVAIYLYGIDCCERGKEQIFSEISFEKDFYFSYYGYVSADDPAGGSPSEAAGTCAEAGFCYGKCQRFSGYAQYRYPF